LAALVVLLVPLSIAHESLARQIAERDALPALSEPVHDFAGVIDAPSERELDRLSRALQAATGDTLLVVTIDTASAQGDIRDYANELFENRGRGIGDRSKDNGLLILLAVQDRRVWIEVGYGLEGFITDGFAGETSRVTMAPYFRRGEYGAGLLAGARQLADRIGQERGIQLDQLPAPAPSMPGPAAERDSGVPILVFLAIVVLIMLASRRSRRRRRRDVFWGGHPWSGWGGGFGGGFGGGGFGGGGFGGFGGGRSGGGGGGASW
jgi:uncharacterized protein